jgi:hypothetical protein
MMAHRGWNPEEGRMTWTWRYENAEGTPVSGPAVETFSTRSDAETWLGESWQDLYGQGVLQVSLLENGTVAYTMPLTPDDGP